MAFILEIQRQFYVDIIFFSLVQRPVINVDLLFTRALCSKCRSLSSFEGAEKANATWVFCAEEDRKKNAMYIISVARKIGCSIFLLWDDLVEVLCRILFKKVLIVIPLSSCFRCRERVNHGACPC